MSRWRVEAGRLITFDGKPFVHIAKEGDTEPVEADGVTHFFAECLNQAGVTPDDIWQKHMGHPRRRQRHARESNDDRPISMTYGTLPPFKDFIRDIRRPDPDHPGQSYWPKGTLYPMELTGREEISLAEEYGRLQPFASHYSHKAGFRGDERAIYGFLEHLIGAWNDGNEAGGDLASSIMTTLGYEWI